MNDKNLDKHTDKNTSLFNINYKNFIGKVVNILSGNKIRVIINIDNNYLKFNIILNKTLDINIIGSKDRLYNLITNDDDIDPIEPICSHCDRQAHDGVENRERPTRQQAKLRVTEVEGLNDGFC